MTDTIPTSVWSGSFSLFGVEVKCHTLSDGQRIIEADSMRRLIDAMIDGPGTADEQQPITEDFLKFIMWRQNP